ncbi:MAG: NAD-dependent epimerase/dehydratase family protein [Nonomuraea sp.]|nr:NAD-dependent epimerase/dehydratase family protein [Nonomuraea sp.]NUP62535.1 NAD-dependent epimerase/dehydratase family protein [Nonomuraea sp.]NUP77054.1 NAD-dependent epimerase/dehydratase family protein [Nonomuraea sp.]NUS06859.1 NAD-dependent epimerase/dehydratase family protein [Nonomuraea sp.]NUT40894.1 NAD-dependent epimerase/dehydratase family protein [Thermoactinospora sp.]
MRVLVTGGAGFIGSNLVDRLLADGHEVVAVDDLSTGSRDNLAKAAESDRFNLHVLDVRDPAMIGLAAELRPEVICHLAAQISVRKSVADPVHDARLNVEGTASVLTAAKEGTTRKVVFSSSVAVYGRPATIPVPAGAATDPRSPYAASKLSGEIYLTTFRALYGLEYTTLVLSNVYGPRQSPEGEAGVVSIFTDALLNGTPTVVYGDGTQTRDYVYVDDVVDGFVRACGQDGNGQRFNLGTGIQTTDRRLHSLIADAAGAQDKPGFAPPRPGDLPAMAVDPVPAHEGLGWEPRVDLPTGVKNTVAWARSRTR